MLTNISIILVKPRFPENIGMAARACANMGCPNLYLVEPERWDFAKALPLATPQGREILEKIKIFDDVAYAIKDFQLLCATTARLGGWRKEHLLLENAAPIIAKALKTDTKIGILFGPEDRGLTNQELIHAHLIIHIPTALQASSLNLAQSVLLVLYELAKYVQPDRNEPKNKKINIEDQERLEASLKSSLMALGCLHGKNPDYFFLQWRRILRKANLQRHEYDAIMGFCRQLNHFIAKSHN